MAINPGAGETPADARVGNGGPHHHLATRHGDAGQSRQPHIGSRAARG